MLSGASEAGSEFLISILNFKSTISSLSHRKSKQLKTTVMRSLGHNQDAIYKLVLLCILAVYTSIATFVIHKSRAVPKDELYSPATSVFFGELFKMMISIILVKAATDPTQTSDLCGSISEDQQHQRKSFKGRLLRHISEVPTLLLSKVKTNEAWRLSIPAGLYVTQNLLQLSAMSSLPPLSYQAISQFKIAVVAAISVVVLQKRLTIQHWLYIHTLLIGVVIVQVWDTKSVLLQVVHHTRGDVKWYWSKTEVRETVVPHIRGPFLLLSSITVGSLAGVLLERIFKSDTKSGGLWIKNAQLSFFSLAPATFFVGLECYQRKRLDILHHFGPWAWATVGVRVLGGVIVALILKHTDNILKAFATSSAIVLSLICQSLLQMRIPKIPLVLGAFLVIQSTIGYSFADLNLRIKQRSQFIGSEVEQSKGQHLSNIDKKDLEKN